MEPDKTDTYVYTSPEANPSSDYLWKPILKILQNQSIVSIEKIFEIGCGNGATANMLSKNGYVVTGIDTSQSGIKIANRKYPEIRLIYGSVYDELVSLYGTFPAVISLEVIEHLYSPRHFVKNVFNLLDDGGIGIISTPYHGYWKNLTMAISGKLDGHYTALWDGGHIKFWSMKTLRTLLEEAGFNDITFVTVGRIPVLAKSMIAIVKK